MKHEPPAELSLPRDIPDDFVPTPPGGLTQEEAHRRLQDGKGNKSTATPGKSMWQVLSGHLFTLFNLLNVGMALLLVSVRAYRNMLFMGVILSNVLIGTIQEIRAYRTVQKMKLKSESPVSVLRDGAEIRLSPDDLVQGDLVVLRRGDQIPADAVVRDGSGAANESLVTGESRPVYKREGACLLSGSFISSGTLVAQLTRVGDDSYISRLQHSAKKIKQPASQLLSDMRRLVNTASFIMLPIAALLFVKQFFYLHHPIEEVIPRCVAAMVGMLPEGLILLTSMALTAGVVKLGRKGTLINHLFGIESLARVDMLCLDKTGTLTSGEMNAEALVPEGCSQEELEKALRRFLGPMDLHSATLRALAKLCPPGDEEAAAILDFSSERKCSGVLFTDGTVLVLGAPSMILGAAYTEAIQDQCTVWASDGLRVVCLAEMDGLWTDVNLAPVRRILGFALIRDRLRDNVSETLQYFKEQGVGIRVISGDDPATVSRIAAQAGIQDAEKYADVSFLCESTPKDTVRALVRENTVFGRVSPQGKCMLIEALKAEGHNVAMTGDGVNDIPAMKSSDCAIAIGSGSDAARRAAQVVLLDNDFAALPSVVNEGRRVINNISRSATLFLVKTLYSFALSILILFLPASYPFRPVQLTLISSLTIGIPSFLLAFEPNFSRVRGHFLRDILLKAVPGGLAVTLCAGCAAFMECMWSPDVCSTIATVSAGAAGLCVLLLLCLPPNRLRTTVFSMSAAALTLIFVFLGRAVYLVPLVGQQVLALAGLCVFSLLVILILTRVIHRSIEKLHARDARRRS